MYFWVKGQGHGDIMPPAKHSLTVSFLVTSMVREKGRDLTQFYDEYP